MQTVHSEYKYKSSSDTVLVFTHGIQGSPMQFNKIINSLKGEYSIENLLLPGHGNSVKEFVNSSLDEWQKCLDNRIELLEKEYKNIILVGHSMGGYYQYTPLLITRKR